ncbi:endonuclease/exonuclease/phosphatase family protein [Streptomyces sp. SID13031]|uniref:endonuclease/exonuclease/phosphatase family protein n=1 Tax=Streptomyces sp. SID13031 TaxID=2706046 RepID=UPI0013CB8994|nr:endonuclease/exonuclease/phosphatase family protein [Streptomyces sp. SID13031]NEA33963.1 endonuclease/exonuclease/phosphatase family protein [Streptomyces sp. SID13031]
MRPAPEGHYGPVDVASLNTRGMPIRGSRLKARYAAIGAAFEASSAQVVNFQEVLSYYHLRRLATGLPSFQAVYQASMLGPAGGLVTFTRLPVESSRYQRLAAPRGTELSLRWRGFLKGALVTRIAGLSVVNAHLLANTDGTWSAENRFHPIHRAQLTALAQLVAGPCVVTGDFNLPRHQPLIQGFLATTGLADAFGGECPPTFQAAYLPAGTRSQCIEFILVKGLTAETAEVLFPDKLPSLGTYVSDHLGLQARLVRSLPGC